MSEPDESRSRVEEGLSGGLPSPATTAGECLPARANGGLDSSAEGGRIRPTLSPSCVGPFTSGEPPPPPP
ncbi:MAG: hypothetical protein ACK559_40895, partial [bacterium]